MEYYLSHLCHIKATFQVYSNFIIGYYQGIHHRSSKLTLQSFILIYIIIFQAFI